MPLKNLFYFLNIYQNYTDIGGGCLKANGSNFSFTRHRGGNILGDM